MWIYLTLSLLLISGLRADDNSSGSSEENEGIVQVVISLVKNKCDAQVFNELKNLTDHYEQYVYPKPEDTPHRMTCKQFSEYLYKRIENVLNILEPCLDSEENYIPDFVLSSYNASLKGCKEGTDTFETKTADFSKAVSKCKHDHEHILNSINDICSPKLKVAKNIETDGFILSKSNLCSDFETVKECGINIIKEQCEDDVVSEFVTDLVEPFSNWCSEHAAQNEVDSD